MQPIDSILLRANGHRAAYPEYESIPHLENYWLFNERLNQRLMKLNILNIVVGLVLGRGTPFWRGIASQNVGWGAINIAIALVGRWLTWRKFTSVDAPYAPEVMQQEAANLRRILLINIPLNIAYMLAGFGIIRSTEHEDQKAQRRRGMGWGIIAQGMLLFCFDTFHVLRVPNTKQK